MRSRHGRKLTIVALGAAALAAGGCGDSDDGAKDGGAQAATNTAKPAPTATATTAGEPAAKAVSGQDPVAQAADVTQRQKGGIAVSLRGLVTASGQRVPISGRGTVDRKGQRSAFTITTTVNGQDIPIDEVTDDGTLYISSKLFEGKLPGGKSWMRIDLDKAAKQQGFDLDVLGTSGPSQDPTQALDYLKGAGASTKVGTEEVRGVKTTHYRVDVDLRKALKDSKSKAAKETIDKLIETMDGSTTMPVDVWIDADNLIRRERVRYDATINKVKSGLDFTTDFTDFDVAVKGKAPAREDTVDGLALLSKRTSG
jgi:hypothetical protein